MTLTRPGSDRLAAYRSAAATRTPAEREAEIERHLPLVHSVVERLMAHLPPTVDRDDLFHAGVIGLIDAIERFDASRGNAFSTYAVLRIRGAVIDELRARDWVPRGARQRSRDYQRALDDLHRRLGRLPDHHELADELGIDSSDIDHLEREAHIASQISLETPVG
ncbi:MAG: sigma-70 family RNA polymerase sigma factor, partial [Planctomycetota bacterium]